MSLIQTICSQRGVESCLAVTPVLCRRFTKNRGVVEEIHAAYTVHLFDRTSMSFWPGVTGFEAFYLTDVVSKLNASERDFVSTAGLFGPTRWEDQDWGLCAGSDTYDKLTVSNGELREAIGRLIAAGGMS